MKKVIAAILTGLALSSCAVYSDGYSERVYVEPAFVVRFGVAPTYIYDERVHRYYYYNRRPRHIYGRY